MECCNTGSEPPLPDVEVSREETYELVPDTTRTLWINIIAGVISCAVLNFLLRLPGGPVDLPPIVALIATIVLGLSVFLILALPHFGGDIVSRLKIFPKGIELLRRDGSQEMRTWPEIRGYVYQKDYIILLTEGDGVSIRLLGFSRMQVAVMRAALRLRLAHGSMEWRGRASASRARGANYPALASLVCILGGGTLHYFGYRKWAGAVFVLSLAYLLFAFLRRPRK